MTAKDINAHAEPLLIVDKGFAMSAILSNIYPHPERTMELPVQTACELLRQGIGAAFLTRTVIAKYLAAGTVVEVNVRDIPLTYRECVLVHLSRNQILPAAQDFIDTLQIRAGSICVPVKV